MTCPNSQPKPPWRPRASGVGNYLACLWRAANDRAIYEGTITNEQAQEIGNWESTGNAPHGTIIHWTTQVGIGCVFPPREPTAAEVEEAAEHFVDGAAFGDPQIWADAKDAALYAFRTGNPKAYAPPAADWAKALGQKGGATPAEQGLFRGNEENQKRSIAAASQMLANDLPRAADGRPWQAEVLVEADWVSGHIDLLSHDGVEVGDIKTTAKPPEMGGYLKPGYLAQIVIYGRLTGSRKAFIEYVDSMQGRWTYRVNVDLTAPARIEYGNQLEGFCRFLMSDTLWAVAYPNLGSHCRDTWCPYRRSCADRIFPTPGKWYDAVKAFRPSGMVAIGPVR
jgi:hypothetical protein